MTPDYARAWLASEEKIRELEGKLARAVELLRDLEHKWAAIVAKEFDPGSLWMREFEKRASELLAEVEPE